MIGALRTWWRRRVRAAALRDATALMLRLAPLVPWRVRISLFIKAKYTVNSRWAR